MTLIAGRPNGKETNHSFKELKAAPINLDVYRTCTPTIIFENKQSDVALFYSPYCFIVCAVRETPSGGPRWFIGARGECSRRHWGRRGPPTTDCICYMSWWTILEFLLFCVLVCGSYTLLLLNWGVREGGGAGSRSRLFAPFLRFFTLLVIWMWIEF